MAYPVWLTPTGSLGIIPEDKFYEFQLDAYNPGGGSLTYSFISGQLPPGVELTSAGSIQGVPIVIRSAIPLNQTYEFSVRTTNSTRQIADRTFSLTISNIVPLVITPKANYLGNYFDGTTYDGTFFNVQLEAIEVDASATLNWTLVAGSLPAGLTLSSSGLISGYILPIPVLGNAGLLGYSNAFYNEFAYDNSPTYTDSSYQFTVQVSDGLNVDRQSYTLNVTAKSLWTADNNRDVVSDNYLTVDHDNLYIPIVTTPPQTLPTIRSNSNFAFKFDAFSPSGNPIQFYVSSPGTSGFDEGGIVGFDSTYFDETGEVLPSGVAIDPYTGWFSGHIPTQAEASINYIIDVQAFETANPTYISLPVRYTLTVLGDINNTITWTTPTDLGTIDNGAISELSVTAVPAESSKILTYRLAPISNGAVNQINPNYQITDATYASRMPQGLTLLPSGLITGRTSFRYFKLDDAYEINANPSATNPNGTAQIVGSNTSGGVYVPLTTIDGGATTFDNTYTFSVLAEATDGSTSSIRTFTVRLKNYNTEPYENLYIKALPSLDQRETFLNIVNNQEIFPENLLYRPTDPWFGRAQDIRSLFLPGLSPSELAEYAASVSTNHYNKRIEFGNVQTARAVDENFNTKYEVVYVPLIDTEIYNGNSPANSNYLNYTNFTGNVYPNSFENMQSVVSSQLGYANQGALPNWMTAPQANEKVLGFTRCIVLAYTIPNASALIAYRLKANGIVFNSIDFVADRYDLDNVLTANYDIVSNNFVAGSLTTFDSVAYTNSIKYYVDYAVVGIPFDRINNQRLSDVLALGGLDGTVNFTAGQTLIFAQQENYNGYTDPHDGWVFADGSVVPGYKEHLYTPSIVNKRAGIWQINITNPSSGFDANIGPTGGAGFTTLTDQPTGIGFDTTWFDLSGDAIVTLTFVQPAELGDEIKINHGVQYGSRVVLYNASLQGSETVPAYTLVNNANTIYLSSTVFDNNKTLFINNVDVYQTPGQNDAWIKFPKTTILQ